MQGSGRSSDAEMRVPYMKSALWASKGLFPGGRVLLGHGYYIDPPVITVWQMKGIFREEVTQFLAVKCTVHSLLRKVDNALGL